MTSPITGPILLPDKPALKTDSPSMLDWGGALTPQNGGAVQTLLRLGTRHALDFTIPTMPTEPLGRIWAAKLRLAKLHGALLPFGQDGMFTNYVGAQVQAFVDGAGQSGSTLVIRAWERSELRLGQAFSLVSNARRYLHFAADNVIAGDDGTMTVPIFPMLRVIPNDGDVVEIARPMIQGSLSGNSVKWTRQTAPWSDFGTITITEDE